MTQRPDAITVEIERDLEPIVPEFIENRKKDCQLILHLLEMDSFGEIRTLGHRMKGAGGSYGFDSISDLGERIEEAALSGDRETIAASVKQLHLYLERVVAVYI